MFQFSGKPEKGSIFQDPGTYLMKLTKKFWIAVIALTFFSCKGKREDIRQFAPAPDEVYQTDTVLQSMGNKRAMVVIAHDDDMCSMMGTISKLNKVGWDIEVLSFHKGAERDSAQRVACARILDSVTFFDLAYSQWRKDADANEKVELSVPRHRFAEVFDSAIVATELVRRINEFKPSVLFTLDNEIGGYGHAEHVFISQLALDLAKSKSIAISRIYQNVMTRQMTERIMARHSKRMKSWGFPGDDWEKAKQIYKVSGMPAPTTQVLIASEATEKMNYLRSFNERERKTIGFFIPAFQDYSADEYFEVFDREFFNVIKIQ